MRILLFGLVLLLSSHVSYSEDFFCYDKRGKSEPSDTLECSEDSDFPFTREEYEDYKEDRRNSRSSQSGGRGSSDASRCENDLKKARLKYAKALNTPQDTAGFKAAKDELDALIDCRSLELVAQSHGQGLVAYDTKRTMDGIATCVQKAGYTTDYDSCKSTASAYDTIMTMEKLLLTSQGVRNSQNQQKVQNQASAQVLSGDGQNAVFDATIADSQFKKNLGKEQLMAYTAAIAFLGSKVASWKSGKCGGSGSGKPLTTPEEMKDPSKLTNNILIAKQLPEPKDCQSAIGTAMNYRGKDLVANDAAKQAFTAALVGFVAKAAAAKALMDRMAANSQIVQAAKDQTATPDNSAVFQKCVITPLDPECVKASRRVEGQSFSQGDFAVGEGFGNNGFDLGGGTDDSEAVSDLGGAGDGNGAVASVGSPFGNDVKDANDILDPAAAAQTGPGAPGAGGGGGVGGGLGGGGASLGNDLQGEDKGDKASDIKANKLAGNYNSTGGKGFSALAGGKEENPFNSLFDSKSEGGLEEDRSIASDDGGKDSGLFQRISNRMGQVVADKRIEAQNLE